MADSEGPGKTGSAGPDHGRRGAGPDEDLERRKRELESKLAARNAERQAEQKRAGGGGASGYGQAVKLSSEFIAGVAVGAGLGWIVDRFAGTSPFGLIVFLLLGFGAGVLNVMRSAGVVAQAGVKIPPKDGDQPRS